MRRAAPSRAGPDRYHLNDSGDRPFTEAGKSRLLPCCVSGPLANRVVMCRRNERVSAMRQFLFLFVVMATVGIGVARYSDRNHGAGDARNAMAMATKPSQASASASRTVTLVSDRQGHFQTDLRIEGRAIPFMVDTGASSIALRESAAAKIGIFPTPRDYKVRMQTANGEGRAARVRLSRVDLQGITLHDVEALVVPDEALGVNLLGMSFLSRVKWTHEHGKLVLEQ